MVSGALGREIGWRLIPMPVLGPLLGEQLGRGLGRQIEDDLNRQREN